MRAVVTGGSGFLGSHLCDRLLKEGWDVLALDNLITGDAANVGHLKANKHFQFVKKDVNEPVHVDGGVGYVFHFASPASPPDYLKFPIETLKVGSLGTMHALDLAIEKKAKFFLASTSECYGDQALLRRRKAIGGT
jgi:dTDP-glucose 4,6-dehydratase